MKKIIRMIAMLILFTLVIFSGKSYAVELTSIDVDTDKTTVRPGENVTVSINFGQELGAYTFSIAYDNAIFDYVSAEGGTANDTTDKINVVYFDTEGGSNPRTGMSVTFKAKEALTTSNPTEFTITAEGLANSDASETYDDITTPIVKNVMVEPEYVDYTLNLVATGDIIKGEDSEMKLSYSSTMGRYYEHARLVASATSPDGAIIQLMGTDPDGLEHDIIQSGWGDAQGYPIGGKDFSQILNVRGNFSEIGDYTITLKIIDRDDSDKAIAEETFNFTVLEPAVVPPVDENNPSTNPNTPGTVTPEEPSPEKPTTQEPTNEEKSESNTANSEKNANKEKTSKMPTKLPKTGINIYVPIVLIIISLVSFYVYYNKRK